MDDASKIRPFPNEASRAGLRDLLSKAQHVRPPMVEEQQPGRKLGLYPLADDVIISLPLYHLIIAVLDDGSPADQQKVAEMMRMAYAAPFPTF